MSTQDILGPKKKQQHFYFYQLLRTWHHLKSSLKHQHPFIYPVYPNPSSISLYISSQQLAKPPKHRYTEIFVEGFLQGSESNSPNLAPLATTKLEQLVLCTLTPKNSKHQHILRVGSQALQTQVVWNTWCPFCPDMPWKLSKLVSESSQSVASQLYTFHQTVKDIKIISPKKFTSQFMFLCTYIGMCKYQPNVYCFSSNANIYIYIHIHVTYVHIASLWAKTHLEGIILFFIIFCRIRVQKKIEV